MASGKGLGGYDTFAEFIASDAELSIFRRFDRMNARNLLYLQSELLVLEFRLDEYDKEDIEDGTPDVMLSARCWETLASRAEEHTREGERMELIKRIRNIAKDYNEALLVRAELLKLYKPGSRAFDAYSKWFEQNKPLTGLARRRLLENEGDFVALKTIEENNKLTEGLGYLTGLFLAQFGSRLPTTHGPIYYSETSIQRVVSTFSVIGAVLLLELAIVALYLVSDDHVRFGLIAIFTSLFAASLTIFSNARRAEMFAATAAYAAVLVVFLSGNLNNGGDSSG